MTPTRAQLWRDLVEVVRGDLLLQLRDPLALLFMLVLPLAVFPGMFFGVGSAQNAQVTGFSAERVTLSLPAELHEHIEEDDLVVLVDSDDAESADAEVRLTEAEYLVRYRGSSEVSLEAVDRAQRIVQRHRQSLRTQAWAEAGMPVAPVDVLMVATEDLAPPADRSGLAAGRVVPPLMIFLIMGTGLYLALELFAGDKEKGTIETLLTARIDRRALVLGRFGIVVIFALATAWLALLSLTVTLSTGLVDLPGGESSVALGPGAIALLALLLVPLCLQLSSLLVLISAWSPSYKTGQAIALPLFMMTMTPAAVAAIPQIQASTALGLVPITNLSLAIRDGVAGVLTPGFLAVTLVATVVHTGLLLWGTLRLLDQEGVLLGGRELGRRRKLGDYRVEALGTWVLVMLLFWYLGQIAQSRDLAWGLVFSQVVLLAGMALVVPVWLGLPVRETLSIRAPRWRDLGLGLLAGICAPGLGQLVFQVQQPLFPVPTAFLEEFAEAMDLDLTLGTLLLLFAVLPAICEELLYRGALQGLLRASTKPWVRILLVGAAFGMMHMALPRLLPTGLLGVAFAAALWRSRSLMVPVLMHFLNNGLLVAADELGLIEDATLPIPVAIGLSVGCILAIAAMGRGQSSPSTTAG